MHGRSRINKDCSRLGSNPIYANKIMPNTIGPNPIDFGTVRKRPWWWTILNLKELETNKGTLVNLIDGYKKHYGSEYYANS